MPPGRSTFRCGRNRVTEVRQWIDTLIPREAPTNGVYVLELAGEDDRFAAAEAGNAATGVTPLAPGLATAEKIDLDRFRGLAFSHRASRLVGTTDCDIQGALDLLRESDLSLTGSVAVRARDVRGTTGIDTQRAERVLGGYLTDNGFVVDLEKPDQELRVLFAGDRCALGWLVSESVRDFGSRAPTDRPFFQPGSMDPLEARAIANLAGAGPDMTVLDPMCGTGGLLLEAGLIGADVYGVDVQRKMVAGAGQNLTDALTEDGELVQGDAARLPLCGEVDVVVFDVPYGRQSTMAGRSTEELLEATLEEVGRLTDRAVVVADRSHEAIASRTGWSVEDSFDRPVHRSLTRHVHVLAR